jgi:hypothetical protein
MRQEEVLTVFGRKKRGPSKSFVHQGGCRIVQADPNVSIEWQEVERGFWEARCVSGVETYREPAADDRVRLSPYDLATARHLGQCEFASETDAAMLRVLLKVTDNDDYDGVECGSCDTAWQVPHYAESVG